MCQPMKAHTFGIVAVAIGSRRRPLGRRRPQTPVLPTSSAAGRDRAPSRSRTADASAFAAAATNTESGNTLKLGLNCASDSYKFELQSDITYEDGNVSGSLERDHPRASTARFRAG